MRLRLFKIVFQYAAIKASKPEWDEEEIAGQPARTNQPHYRLTSFRGREKGKKKLLSLF